MVHFFRSNRPAGCGVRRFDGLMNDNERMDMRFKKLVAATAVALVSMGAFADSATMDVSASIAAECSVGNAVALDFGTLSTLSNGGTSSAASTSTGGGTFDVICTNGSPTPLLAFTSENSSGSDFVLLGADGSSKIPYTLKESGGTPIAYNTAAAFTGLAADGATHNLAIVGSIAASDRNGKLAQAYTDQITITSSFAP